LKGNNVRKNKIIKGAEIIDILPTVLYMMGIPVPIDVDGKVLTECFVKVI